MNIREKLNETGLAKKINDCDFGIALLAASKYEYNSITNKNLYFYKRIIQYPLLTLHAYIGLKMAKNIAKNIDIIEKF